MCQNFIIYQYMWQTYLGPKCKKSQYTKVNGKLGANTHTHTHIYIYIYIYIYNNGRKDEKNPNSLYKGNKTKHLLQDFG